MLLLGMPSLWNAAAASRNPLAPCWWQCQGHQGGEGQTLVPAAAVKEAWCPQVTPLQGWKGMGGRGRREGGRAWLWAAPGEGDGEIPSLAQSLRGGLGAGRQLGGLTEGPAAVPPW